MPWTTTLGAVSGAVQAGTNLLGIGLQNTYNQQNFENQLTLQHNQYLNQLALANNQQQLAQQNWDYTNYENQVKHMQNAGLNIGLMYNGSGQGGQSLGQGQGSAAGASAIPLTNPFKDARMMDIASAMSNIRLQEAQANNLSAQSTLANAQAKKVTNETPTSGSLGDITLENLKQAGIAQWFENLKTEYMNKSPEEKQMSDGEVYRNVIYNKQGSIPSENSLNIQKFNAELFKTEAEKLNLDANALLTNTKAQGYWQELLNETAKADAAGIQAKAQKLAAEWNTGVFTNWKTWADLGMNAVKAAGSLIKGSVNVNKENTYNQNGDRWNDK